MYPKHIIPAVLLLTAKIALPALSMNCTDNGSCATAQFLTLNVINADSANICLTDCNVGATTNSWNFNGTCPDIINEETVYYSFTTTHVVLSISFTSVAITQPQLILMTNTCTGYYTCNVGSGGSVSMAPFNTNVGVTYTIMITSQSGETGTYSLCISNYSNPAACILADTLIANPIPDTTGWNLSGSYPTGTTVQFCYTINQFSKVNCNYLEGIVPILGSGWDPASFTITQMPVSADSFGTWNWFTAANQPVMYNSTGDTVNKFGGFFYLNNCMNCPVNGGDPDNSWGDGYCSNPCQCDIAGSGFTWNLCFTVTSNSDCNAGTDLSVGIKTYADGEIGAYTQLSCSADPLHYPAFVSPELCCSSCPIVPVSFTDSEKQGVKVYPNPSSGKFSVQINDFRNSNYDLILLNALGIEVVRQSLNMNLVSLIPNIPPGIYCLEITNADGVVAKEKIIIFTSLF